MPTKHDVLQTVVRALAVLEVLAQNPHGVTPKLVSTKLGLNLSTAYHLLNTLLVAGYAVQSSATHLFQLGPRVETLHAGFQESLRVAPRLVPFVHALNQATGATAMLGQWENEQVIASAIVDGEDASREMSHYVGFAGAAHAMALGKVLLAWTPTDQAEAYLAKNGLRRFTSATLTEPRAFRAELTQVRQLGYALDREGFLPGYSCVAAPVFSADGSVKESLAVTVATGRFELEQSALIAATQDIARAASFAMGATPARFARES